MKQVFGFKLHRLLMYVAVMFLGAVQFSTSASAGTFIREDFALWQKGSEYVGIDIWRNTGQNRNPRSNHPYRADERNIVLTLKSLEISNVNGQLLPLFTDQQATDLAVLLTQAFAKASKKTDVIFSIENKKRPNEFIIGRMFFVDNRLNLILGGKNAGDAPGVRAKAADEFYELALKSGIEYVSSERQDWVQLKLESLLRESLMLNDGFSGNVEKSKEYQQLKSEVESLRQQLAEKESLLNKAGLDPNPTQPKCIPNHSAAGKIEGRIKVLEQLKDKGVISDSEFNELRGKILNEL